jgi:hypothetical protein
MANPEIDGLKAEIARLRMEADSLRGTLKKCKQKLGLYRQSHGGEYVGGTEFTQLIAEIDRALGQAT